MKSSNFIGPNFFLSTLNSFTIAIINLSYIEF